MAKRATKRKPRTKWIRTYHRGSDFPTRREALRVARNMRKHEFNARVIQDRTTGDWAVWFRSAKPAVATVWWK